MNNEFGIVLHLVLVKETSRAPREEAVVDVDHKHKHVLTIVLVKKHPVQIAHIFGFVRIFIKNVSGIMLAMSCLTFASPLCHSASAASCVTCAWSGVPPAAAPAAAVGVPPIPAVPPARAAAPPPVPPAVAPIPPSCSGPSYVVPLR